MQNATVVTGPQTISLGDIGLRPLDSDLDFFGMTHRGRVRTENLDHFLVCSVHPQAVVHGTSLPSYQLCPSRSAMESGAAAAFAIGLSP